MRAEEITGLMEAYSHVYEPSLIEDEVVEIVAEALISQGYSAIDVLEYFANVEEETIIEDIVELFDGTLILESVVSEEYAEEQLQQLDEFLGAALRIGSAAAKAAKYAPTGAKLGQRAMSALGGAGKAAQRVAQQGTKSSAVVRPALSKAVGAVKGAAQKAKGAAGGVLGKAKSALGSAVSKVKGAAKGALSKLPGGSTGRVARTAKMVGKAALGGAAFEGGMRAAGSLANKLSSKKSTAAKATGAAPAKPAAKPAPSAPAAKPAPSASPKSTAPAKPAVKQSGNKAKDMKTWAEANPKLAAAKAERDRTRGTSATTNPLMKDLKDKLPAPKPETKTESIDVFDLIKGYLLDEGYADTDENALVIMTNMSEEWRSSILEAYGIQILDEAQAARENPEKHEEDEEEENEKKYGKVRGEKTPMPPRGDKRREEFEKWYAKQMGR